MNTCEYFRKNTKPSGKVDIWHRMFHYYQMNREEFYQHYHKRSNVESTFSMIKAKIRRVSAEQVFHGAGERSAAKSFVTTFVVSFSLVMN